MQCATRLSCAEAGYSKNERSPLLCSISVKGRFTGSALKASCQKLYAPRFKEFSPIPEYPLYCSHREFDNGDECGMRLTRPRFFGDTQLEVPIKRFLAFSFKDYVASLTSRVGFEVYMDDVSSFTTTDPTVMHDVFDGQYLRNFEGPDHKPFRSSSGPEGRYCFSLGFDFFNPFSNKQSGKKVSFGIISVVCLNQSLTDVATMRSVSRNT